MFITYNYLNLVNKKAYLIIINNLGFMKICTHDGRFHCDEVLACTMLVNYTDKFKNATIKRSRDPKVW